MKIAILISGEYRTFGLCRKTMKFLDDPRVDIYFSTWDKTIYNIPKINLYKVEDVTEDIIRKDLGKPAIIEIESHVPFVELKYNSRMIHRWKRGFNLIKNSGIKYDYVLVMRPDIYFNSYADHSFEFIDEFKNILASAWHHVDNPGFLNDIMLLSSYSMMCKMFDQLSIQEWVTSDIGDWHTWWYKFVKNYFPVIETLDRLARCTFCRHWVNETHSFLEIKQIQEDWSDLVVLQISDNVGRVNVEKNWPSDVIIRMDQKWKSGIYDKYI